MTYDAGGYGPAGTTTPGSPPTGIPAGPGIRRLPDTARRDTAPPPGYPPPYGAPPPGYGYPPPVTGRRGTVRRVTAPPPVFKPGVVPLRPLEPVRHVQRRGRLYPRESQSHTWPHDDRRGRRPAAVAGAVAGAVRDSPGNSRRAMDSDEPTAEMVVSWAGIEHHRERLDLPLGDPAHRSADRRGRPGDIRCRHHDRRKPGSGSGLDSGR